MPQSGDYSLYFHVPFCTKKCGYCHFYVIPDQERFKHLYMQALKKEWSLRAPSFLNKNLCTIYFGGGTPFLLGPQRIEEILSWINPPATIEITLEANPENISFEILQAYRKAGINRLSIGIQALDDHLLTSLGRTHRAKEAYLSVEMAYQAGFENISIDLMYDLPNQTPSQWEETMDQALTLPLTHLSLYNLTIEPHTPFYKNRKQIVPRLPNQETSLLLLETAISKLQEKGLARYEISAFAKPGYFSKHNTGYWTKRPFLGLGPSAFSYWKDTRFRNIAHLNRYARLLEEGKDPIDFSETLPLEEQIKEEIAIGLRLTGGIPFQPIWSASIQKGLYQLEQEGWLMVKTNRLFLTAKGLLFHDTVAEAIMSL